MLSLSACATAPSERVIICPSVAAYDRAFQARLADEIQRLPPGAALERAMLDYARLRDQARACDKCGYASKCENQTRSPKAM
jgi:hypothetical protein